MYVKRLRLTAAIASLALVTACATRIPFELESSEAPIDVAAYQQAAAEGANIYEIVPENSVVLMRVGRAGTMSQLGHDHVIASTDLEGLIAVYPDATSSFGAVAMPLKNLIVDKPVYRQQLELDSTPSEKDIAGTYSNMQKVLDAESWPWTVVQIEFADAEAVPPLGNVTISMHGATHSYVVPLELDVTPESLSVEGGLTVKHSDFGMTPFSALGGLLRVADEVEILFDLNAERRNGE